MLKKGQERQTFSQHYHPEASGIDIWIVNFHNETNLSWSTSATNADGSQI